jgi:hypothetical protein
MAVGSETVSGAAELLRGPVVLGELKADGHR